MNKKYELQCIVGGRSGGKTQELKKMRAIKEFEEKYNVIWKEQKDGATIYLDCFELTWFQFKDKEYTIYYNDVYSERGACLEGNFLEDMQSIIHLYYLEDNLLNNCEFNKINCEVDPILKEEQPKVVPFEEEMEKQVEEIVKKNIREINNKIFACWDIDEKLERWVALLKQSGNNTKKQVKEEMEKVLKDIKGE